MASLSQFGAAPVLRRWRRTRLGSTILTLGLVVLGPVLASSTFLVSGPFNGGGVGSGLLMRGVLLADLVYVLVIAALVLGQVGRLFAARRAKSAGSRLHLRLIGVFTLLALIPTVTVAVFAGLTINIGLEGWFSDRVRNVVGSSLAAAQAYKRELSDGLSEDAQALANFLDNERSRSFFMDAGRVRQLLGTGQNLVQRGLREAYVIDGSGAVWARGEGSYLFDFEKPAAEVIELAQRDGLVIIEDWDNDEFRALIPLRGFVDRLLYVSREVDGDILSLLDETQETVLLYQQLEQERGRVLFNFGLLYLGFALILILAAMWLGLWFAERLSRPVGRLTNAAQKVGAGDLDVRVVEDEGDDEISMLGRYFNQMTRQLKAQRQTLLDNTRQIEDRRRLFDSVLSSVTSGVVGLDRDGQVTFVNRSARRLLDWEDDGAHAMSLSVAVPEFMPLYEELKADRNESVQGSVKVTRGGRLENLLVRVAVRRGVGGTLDGYVVAFDDVTDLVSAQRMAAWGDVARRIAHEIKNPLTPIQLSAERIKRKYAPLVGDDSDRLESMTDVIIRQTGDLRRIVDEFSKFARMPEPDRRSEDVARIVRDAVMLQQDGQPDVTVDATVPEGPLMADIDATMISQALTNLIKNAGEAIGTLKEKGAPEGFEPRIRVELTQDTNGPVRTFKITVADNGIGLPEDRARLFEPYVTTRDAGTGLGLPIVKKIIEEHGGTLTLEDAPPLTAGQTHKGAMAVIRLPLPEAHQTTERRAGPK